MLSGPGAPDGGSDTDGPGAAALPWLLGDDFAGQLFAVRAPMTPPPPAPPPAQGPAQGPVPADAAPGLLERLTRLPIRADPGRRGAIALGVAVLVTAVVTGGWVLSTRPHALAVSGGRADPAAVASAQSAAASAGSLKPDPRPRPASSTASAPTLVVDIAGKVRHPGLYRLPPGSRVDDAVRAAGGGLPGVDLTNLNLAAKIVDGQQIAVGMPGAVTGAGASGASPGSTASAVTAPLDINSATLAQLETLPGVGPVLGQHILDWRAAHGRFSATDQLREVPGIGDVKFAALRPRVTV